MQIHEQGYNMPNNKLGGKLRNDSKKVVFAHRENIINMHINGLSKSEIRSALGLEGLMTQPTFDYHVHAILADELVSSIVQMALPHGYIDF